MSKTAISAIIGFTVGAVLIVIWSRFVDFSEITSQFSSVNWLPIVFSGAFYILAYFIRSVRWNMLLGLHQKVLIRKTYAYSLAGNLINYLIPIRAGELAKPLFLKRSDNIPITQSLPTVIIDKFFDTIGIFVVLLLIPFLHIELSKTLVIMLIVLIALFVIGFLMLILLSLFPKLMTKLLRRLMFLFPARFKDRVISNLEGFINGMIILKENKVTIIPLTLLTILGVVLDALYFFFIFLAFKVNINFFIVLFGYTLINLSYALPQTPAQIGTNEWMMSIVFSAGFGYDLNIAAAIMAFAHLFTAVILIVTGSVAFSYTGFKLFDIFKRGA
ncbi:MAG: flippase-like domain-containing protein [Candidatus Cloacimonetes bacterium]|nr:flippase-like domain-containing protein [Candidatus Cloacimonadota bacterium]